MSPMTSALISYWQRLPAESPAARRRTLDAIRERVRAGLESRSALVPFALGDVDDGIVAAATQAYATAPGTLDAGPIEEATEWVRRGLALNRGAVFGALLVAGDERTIERLAALRLVLSPAEIEAVGRAVGPAPGPCALAFLRDWAELVAGGALPRESQALQGIIDTGVRAQAA